MSANTRYIPMQTTHKRQPVSVHLFLLTLISILALATCANSQGRSGPGHSPEKWFQTHDTNGDGVVTLEEFASEPPHNRPPSQEKIFARLDANGDGVVTFEEFFSGRPDRPDRPEGEMPSPKDMFNRMDANKDGNVTLDEFQSGMPERPERPERPEGERPSLKDMFEKMDSNGDGVIRLEEVQAAHRQREQGHQARFKESDANGDGKLSFEEFSAMNDSRHEKMAEEFFKRADTNSDGCLQPVELETMHAQRPPRPDGEQHQEKPFEEKDLNGDGKLSLAEFKTGMAHRMFQHMDANGDGYVEIAEFEPMRGPHPEPPEPQGTYAALGTETLGASSTVATATELGSIYPNPFNPMTNLRISLQEAAYVTLSVYDITGRQVETLHEGSLSPGTYSFSFDGTRLASGIYLVRFQAGDAVATQKMMLQK
jgi:Ca2+-binding EF-hand superfamily protein